MTARTASPGWAIATTVFVVPKSTPIESCLGTCSVFSLPPERRRDEIIRSKGGIKERKVVVFLKPSCADLDRRP